MKRPSDVSVTVRASRDTLYLSFALRRPRWKVWKPQGFSVALDRGEAVRLRNLLGGALGRMR